MATEYGLHGISWDAARRTEKPTVALHILVGKSDRIASIPLTQQQTLTLIRDAAAALRDRARWEGSA